jgi:hypothetical protein
MPGWQPRTHPVRIEGCQFPQESDATIGHSCHTRVVTHRRLHLGHHFHQVHLTHPSQAAQTLVYPGTTTSSFINLHTVAGSPYTITPRRTTSLTAFAREPRSFNKSSHRIAALTLFASSADRLRRNATPCLATAATPAWARIAACTSGSAVIKSGWRWSDTIKQHAFSTTKETLAAFGDNRPQAAGAPSNAT